MILRMILKWKGLAGLFVYKRYKKMMEGRERFFCFFKTKIIKCWKGLAGP